MPGYNPQAIEKKWQERWAKGKVFATDAGDHSRPKFYVLDMFPYPSGQGLHVGHPEGYTATDIVARYKRARGFNVMHPMGWDAFGLPAEQYAIKNNVHPRQTTANNIGRFRQQLQALGFSYDWDREVDTTDPHYYRWTQWIFLKLYDTWFDPEEQRGRPIGELIAEFQNGQRPIPAFLRAPSDRSGKVADNRTETGPEGRQMGSPGRKPGVADAPRAESPGGAAQWDTLTPTAQRQILAHFRLAYEAEVPVNWCPGLGTVLANEEVIDGKSEVGGFPVERRPMKQWMLRITAYSERLIAGLENLEWTESLKEMQRNWIGKSEGAEVTFHIAPGLPGVTAQTTIAVFTTRPDTLFGATYMVLAPEHPLVEQLATPEQREKIDAYRKWAAARSDRERQEDTGKTGEFTGSHAINPVNAEKIPIYISDYVLMGYGTGAIMAVPAHDQRDFEFAAKFNLPIVQVVGLAPHGNAGPSAANVQEAAFTEEGVAVNSPWIDGLPTQEAKSKMIALLEEKTLGKRRTQYKIRDWLFSRQRYWGEPFPIVHLEDGTTVRLADSELPVMLPELTDFKPTGTIDPPLSKAKDWANVHVLLQNPSPGIESPGSGNDVARIVPPGTPGAMKARRELNTMPQWAGSCWYYIRYLDPKNEKAFADPTIEKYWLGAPQSSALSPQHSTAAGGGGGGVDLYVGGVEHAVLHLLYSRFWHKVLFDWNLVSGDEPFKRLVNQGMILGENNEKMSKSRGNVVTSESMVDAYGADALRLFEMFMGPLEQVKPWSTAGVEGVYRFLQRVWRNIFDENDAPKTLEAPNENSALIQQHSALRRHLHRLIKKVGDDIERLSFNTAIAAMMEFNNAIKDAGGIDTASALTFLRLLEPFAPHFAEEAFERLALRGNARPQPLPADGPSVSTQGYSPGQPNSISRLPWPSYDPAMLVESTLEIPVQINGKLRSRITVAADADEPAILTAALADPEVQKFLAGKEPKKKIYVKGRMVNLVA